MKIDVRLMALAALGVVLVGCNIGNAPAGASADQFKADMAKAPVEDQVKVVLEAPGPMDQRKIDRIKQIYQDAHKDIPPDVQAKLVAGGGQGAGVPASAAGAGAGK